MLTWWTCGQQLVLQVSLSKPLRAFLAALYCPCHSHACVEMLPTHASAFGNPPMPAFVLCMIAAVHGPSGWCGWVCGCRAAGDVCLPSQQTVSAWTEHVRDTCPGLSQAWLTRMCRALAALRNVLSGADCCRLPQHIQCQPAWTPTLSRVAAGLLVTPPALPHTEQLL